MAIEGVGTILTLGSTSFCFKSISAPGFTVGKLDDTCLSNTTVMTALPAQLRSVEDMSFTAELSPADYVLVQANMGIKQLITIDFEYASVDLGSVSFWGWLSAWNPDAGSVGEVWTVSGTLSFSGRNASGVETDVAYSA